MNGRIGGTKRYKENAAVVDSIVCCQTAQACRRAIARVRGNPVSSTASPQDGFSLKAYKSVFLCFNVCGSFSPKILLRYVHSDFRGPLKKATVKYRCFLFAPTELIPPLGQETSAPKGGDPIKRELPLYGEEEPRQREDKTASFPFSAT